MGWLFLTAGVFFYLTFLSIGYTWAGLIGAPGSLPAAELVAWVNSWIWLIALVATLTAVFLFPTGHPPSAAWWPVLIVWWAMTAMVLITSAFAPIPLSLPTKDLGEVNRSLPNPFGLGGPIGDVLLALAPPGQATAPLMFLVAVASVVVRFRRAQGIERQQVKWFTYAASVACGLLVISFTAPRGPLADIAWATGVLSFGAMPVAAGIAILRYRLYDIDVLINRTLVYGALSAILLGTYVALVLALGALLRPLTGSGDLTVAASTLAVVALFQPLRRRVQAFIDRQFYRSRYDAARTVDAFAARLRDQVDIDSLRVDLLRTVDETVRPAHVSLWLRGS